MARFIPKEVPPDMRYNARQRRLAKRRVARAQTGVKPARPVAICQRCKAALAPGEGSCCWFWKGIGPRRREVLGLVCPACRLELIRTGAGGSGIPKPPRPAQEPVNHVGSTPRDRLVLKLASFNPEPAIVAGPPRSRR